MGGFEGAFLGTIGTMFVVSMSPALREPVFSSHAGHAVAYLMHSAGSVMPGEIHDAVVPFWNRVHQDQPASPPIAQGVKTSASGSRVR